MESKIAQITKLVSQIKGCQFASLTYLSKSTKEIARYTVNLGFSYNTLVEKSVTELEIIMSEITDQASIEYTAAVEVMKSLKKTLTAHANGEQNEDYTKKGQYIPIANGLSVNTTDNTIQLFGLLNSKVVITEGEYKEVNSKPLTIAKNKIRKQLSVSKFREFALDESNIGMVKVNGNTVELNEETFVFEVNPTSTTVPVPVTA